MSWDVLMSVSAGWWEFKTFSIQNILQRKHIIIDEFITITFKDFWRESAVKMFQYVYFTYLKKSLQAHKLHSTSACMVSTLLFARLILNQCRLTRHGKNWSSLFPMPKQPLTFFPQTKSSPRSAKQPSNMSRLRGRAPAEPQHRAAAVCFTGMRHNNNQKSS